MKDDEAATRPILELLRERYPQESHALFTEVRNATGARGDRSADAVALCLYPSHGLEVHGFEFKASRGDWLRELKNPRKSDGVFRFCDRWFLVCQSTGIADVDELPITWGLMIARKDGLRIVKKAPALSPEPLDRAFVASMCRSAQKQIVVAVDVAVAPLQRDKHEQINALREELREDHRRQLEEVRDRERNHHRDVLEGVKEFERLSGIPLMACLVESRRWQMPKVAAVAKFLIEHVAERQNTVAELRRISDSSRAAADELSGLGEQITVER